MPPSENVTVTVTFEPMTFKPNRFVHARANYVFVEVLVEIPP